MTGDGPAPVTAAPPVEVVVSPLNGFELSQAPSPRPGGARRPSPAGEDPSTPSGIV